METHSTQLKERLVEVYKLAIDGLGTDGDHHKQWFLEEILKVVVGEENYDRIFKELGEENDGYAWEPGIAP
jgi:hypothetical protein